MEKEIRTTGDNVEQCLHRVSQRSTMIILISWKAVYLRERASDLKDISRRLIRKLIGATALLVQLFCLIPGYWFLRI